MQKSNLMIRRDFFILSAAGVASLSGCSANLVTSLPVLPAGVDWHQLQAQLQGKLVLPTDADFVRLGKAANARFDHQVPAVIIRCANSADVQLCVQFIRQYQLPFAIRGGGHSYTGFSSTHGVLLDLGLLDQIALDGQIATIGAGAKLGDVYATLGLAGRSIPAGSCVSVGITGLTLGGGLGIADRRFGLTCDALQSVKIVTADGQLRHCSRSEHADLFWALRGGGGGQFGIVTELEFQTFATGPIRNYIGRYPLQNGEKVLHEWQRWVAQLPDSIWSQATIWFSGDPTKVPEIQIRACAMDEPVLLTKQWLQLAVALSDIWSELDMQDHQYLDFMLSDCAGLEMPECKLPNQDAAGQLKRVAMAGSSDIFNKIIPTKGIAQLLNAIRQRHQQGGRGGIMLTAMGGAIQKLPHHDAAFAHRRALLSAQYLMSGPVGSPEALLADGAKWVNQMRNLMQPWSSGGAYLNYTDSLLKDWQQAYYGDHYPRLQQIKTRYDANAFFRGKQHIQGSIVKPARRSA